MSKDESVVDTTQQMIYGFDKKILCFDEVVAQIDHKSKTRFVEQSVGSVGKTNGVITSPILVDNGNIVQEEYHFYKDKIFGRTKLISIAA